MSTPITPATNAKAIDRAGEIYRTTNGKTRQDFNKAYNQAIKELGYTPAYFKACMRKIGPQYAE